MSIIGIDLGTTTSEVAVYRAGKSEIIKNIEEGESTIIPSVVLVENNNSIVGIRAKNQSVLKPNNVVQEIKRLMGTDKKLRIEGKTYTPVEISAMILKKIKDVAEFYIGEKVTEAVITVPANFNDKGRKDTKEAGRLAGLNVERIINEPTAAAIAYGIDHIDKDMNILVYDFGGGTLDVTVLELYKGVLDVKTSRGNNKLGGKNIDNRIITYIAKKFKDKNNLELDLKSARVISALKSASEECKINLSFQEEWDVIIPYIGKDKNNNPLDVEVKVTRNILNKLIENIIKETEDIVDKALESAEVSVDNIEKVILVGGTTRIPVVRKMMEKKFGKEKIAKGVNPDEAVALGAALQCAIKNKKLEKSKSIVVTDTCSHSLGVEVLGGKFDRIIKRDTKLPTKITKQYKTVEDGQDEAVISVYEGELEFVKDNVLLGKIDIDNIPKSESGKEILDITFAYDLNGILNTEVKVISTGNREFRKYKDGQEVENNIEEIECIEPLEDIESLELVEEDMRDVKAVEIFEEEEEVKTVEVVEKENEIEEIEQIEEYVENEEDLNSEEASKYRVEEENELNNQEQWEETEEEEIKVENMEEETEGEEDYSNIFGEVVNLVNYVNANMETYEVGTQGKIKELLADLLGHVKKDEYKECRTVEKEILNLIGIE